MKGQGGQLHYRYISKLLNLLYFPVLKAESDFTSYITDRI